MKVSANEAAKRVGKSPPTISRAIKSGKLSATKLDGGGYEIDEAELYRVWPRVAPKDNVKDNMLNHETPNESGVLQVKLEAKDDKIADLLGQIEDLKTQRDKWQGQAERLLLERPTQEQTKARPGLFGRIMGRT